MSGFYLLHLPVLLYSCMAVSRFTEVACRIRRILALIVITTSTIHKCFNGLEQFMLVLPGLSRRDVYDCYTEDEEEYDEPAPKIKPRIVALPVEAIPSPPELKVKHAADKVEDTPEAGNNGTQATTDGIEEEQPIASQFGPNGYHTHRHVSQHMGGPWMNPPTDELVYFYLLATYVIYLILIAFGQTRDFFGKRFKPERYRNYTEQDGYAPLNSDLLRGLKTRMNDCFSRPITGVPGRYVTLMDRVTDDYCQSFTLAGTLTETLNMSSYDYLGFAQSNGPCADDVHSAIISYGFSSASSRLDVGTSDLTVEVEREIAHFLGKEDAMVFSMGFSTNATSFPALMGPGVASLFLMT